MHFKPQVEIMSFGNQNVWSEQRRRTETVISTVSSGHDDAMTHVSFIHLDFSTNCYRCLIHQHSWIWYHFKMTNIAIPCKRMTPQEMETKHKSEDPTLIAPRLLSLNFSEHLVEKKAHCCSLGGRAEVASLCSSKDMQGKGAAPMLFMALQAIPAC